MTKRRLTRTVLRLAILSLIIFILLILLIGWITPKPPTREFNTYHSMLNNTDRIQTYDKEFLANAEFFRNKAFVEWQKQNKKCFLIRDYTESERMILMAISIMEETKEYNRDND